MTTALRAKRPRILPKALYSVPQAADWLGVVEEVIRRYLRTGLLDGEKVRVRGLKTEWRIRGNHLHLFLNRPGNKYGHFWKRAGRPSKKPNDQIEDVFAELSSKILPEEMAKLPKDWARNMDHYLYGARRR